MDLILTLGNASWLNTAIFALGSFTLFRALLRFSGVILQTFVLPGKSLKKYGAGQGYWAVVTGATDGIGKEFALQLAKAGFNIVLVSRSEEKLRNVANEIESAHNAQTKTVPIDFAHPSETQFASLSKLMATVNVGVLVNNVGRSHELPVSFLETPLSEQHAIIDINVNGTLRVTKIVLAGMVERRKGLIVTLSSFAGNIPSPLLATYSGSKAFLQTWSDALQSELKGTGVDVECLSTYFVVSNMSKIRRSSALIPTPRSYVSSALRKIGLSCGALWTNRPSTSTPYWSHALLEYLIETIGWKKAFISYTLNLHRDIRKRALRKLAREKSQ